MVYLTGAKLVVVAHFGFVPFVFLGALLLVSRPWVVWVHGACLAYAFAITVIGWPFPLTHLEQLLLSRAGVSVYSGEFLPHYVWSRFDLTGSELPVAASMVIALVAANSQQYWSLFRSVRFGA